MKKQSFIMSNESGFFLPYVLFIATLVFIIIAANIRTHQHDIEITHHFVEQLKAETIVQMAITSFNQEYLEIEQDTLNIYYHFPDGEASIIYNYIDDTEYRLHFTVLTTNGLPYTTLKTIKKSLFIE